MKDFSLNRLRVNGVSAGEAVLYGLIALVIVLGGVAIFRSVDIQHKVAATFTGWQEDKAGYDKTMADMKASGKPALVYIYAPWCPHCKHFTALVLSDPKMQAFVQQYPHVRVAPDHGKAEQAIMVDFGAQGYPSFYVVMPDGTRKQIETFSPTPTPHLKTPDEFMAAIKEATGGK